MDMQRIHFICEVLRQDFQGKGTPTMQYSYDNASYLDPVFTEAPSNDQAALRAFYQHLGGSRREGASLGTTVIIPNRSFWKSRWPITAGEVQVVRSTRAAS